MSPIFRYLPFLLLSVATQVMTSEAIPIPKCCILKTTHFPPTSSKSFVIWRFLDQSLNHTPVIKGIEARTTEPTATPTYFTQAQETTRSGLSTNTKTGVIIGGIAACIIGFFVITGIIKCINHKPSQWDKHHGNGAAMPTASGDEEEGDNVIHLRPPPAAHLQSQYIPRETQDPPPFLSSSAAPQLVSPVPRRQWGVLRLSSPSPSNSPMPTTGRRWRGRDEPPPAYEP